MKLLLRTILLGSLAVACSARGGGGISNPGPTDSAVTGDGVTPTDSGTPMDTGTPPVDTGTPPVDTGTPPVDTGTPPVDTGNPPQDTGTPPVDTGTPPRDTGVPPDTRPPVDECSGSTSCADCTGRSTCGWCGGRCYVGTATGPTGASCGGQPWAWTTPQCTGDAGPTETPCTMCVSAMCATELAGCTSTVCQRCATGMRDATCATDPAFVRLQGCACGRCITACTAACMAML
ncbi:MAG: hypothetical protein HY909_23820 [Deltaproteobacteria bacterium]|nr:hypothetical protein [Deltaproteobacteria bacterium]